MAVATYLGSGIGFEFARVVVYCRPAGWRS